MEHRAIVNGQDKGSVFKRHGRWNWQRGADSWAVEPFPKGAVIGDVKNWIKRVCRTDDVRIVLQKD